MSRNILTAVLLLSLGAGPAASAQETNAGAALDWSSFESIAQKNIFDPARSGRGGSRSRLKAAAVRAFTFCGTIEEVAIFKGDGVPARGGDLKVGDTINGFKVMQIPLRYSESPTVKLTDPGGTIVVLQEGESMRREEDGPWTKSDQPAPAAVAASETQADESAASISPASAGENDVLARLRARHKQEE
jgi:hypothetical protein